MSIRDGLTEIWPRDDLTGLRNRVLCLLNNQCQKHRWMILHGLLKTVRCRSLRMKLFRPLMIFQNIQGVYSGVNIKLMKCGGMRAAFTMIKMARALDMKVMIGCMTETSCAVSAAAQLSPLVDWADLDGNLLIDNDVFEGVKIINGKVILT